MNIKTKHLKDKSTNKDIYKKYAKQIKEFLNAKTIYNLEDSNNKILKLLDDQCGIDWVLQNNKNEVKGVGVRCIRSDYNSITIRFKRFTGTKTEFDKKVEAIANNNLTSNIYFYILTDKELNLKYMISFNSNTFFNYINEQKQVLRLRKGKDDGNVFCFFTIQDLKYIQNNIDIDLKSEEFKQNL